MVRILKFVAIIVVLLSLCLSGCSSIAIQSNAENVTNNTSNNTIATSPVKATYLVLISIDACRTDYFSFSDIPNIKQLMSEGVSYSNAWVGELRNDTPPGHTALATGAFPKHNGILGFTWKDPITQQQVRPTDWDPVVSGNMTGIIAASGCSSIGTLYKKAYPDAQVAAISSDKFYAATGLGAESADFILFNAAQHMPDYAKKGGINLAPGGVTGHLAPSEIMNDPALKGTKVNSYDGDIWAIDLAIKLFEKERPQILLINLPQTDHSGHATGGINDPKEMSAVVGNVDKQIGRLIDAYKKAGIYDQTIFVVTSDHAMTPTVMNIDMATIKKELNKASITLTAGGREIYLTDPSRTVQAANIIAQTNVAGLNGVYYKQKAADGSYSYTATPITITRADNDLNKCYQYLTSTYASEKSCDIFLATADENWQSADNITAGNHGAATWTNQHIPLIISGPGVKKGAISESPARIVDIAPTVLTLMGIEPQKMDGIVLADALQTPQKTSVEAQQQSNNELIPLQKALKARSEADLAIIPKQRK